MLGALGERDYARRVQYICIHKGEERGRDKTLEEVVARECTGEESWGSRRRRRHIVVVVVGGHQAMLTF